MKLLYPMPIFLKVCGRIVRQGTDIYTDVCTHIMKANLKNILIDLRKYNIYLLRIQIIVFSGGALNFMNGIAGKGRR